MEIFLRDSKAAVKDKESYDTFIVVLGNEACDLDSAVCAVVYGYLLQKLNSDVSVAVVPVLNVRRSDYRLRTEVKYFFDKVLDSSIEQELTFIDEAPLEELWIDGKLRLVLVDHNQLSPAQAKFADSVVEIIDHHEFTGSYDLQSCDVHIQMVGSCASLIAQQLVTNAPELLCDSVIGSLLYGPIITDSVALSKEAGKVKDLDVEMAEKLETALSYSTEERILIFNSICQARSDVSGLNIPELLRKDLKCVQNEFISVAVSSIPLSFENFESKAEQGLEKDLWQFGLVERVDVLVLLMAFREETRFNKQLAIFSDNSSLLEQFSELFLNSETDLKLNAVPRNSSTLLLYNQGNTTASRKQVLPLVVSLLKNPSFPFDTASGGLIEHSFSCVDYKSEEPEASTASPTSDFCRFPFISVMEPEEPGHLNTNDYAKIPNENTVKSRSSPRSFLDGGALDRSFSITYEEMDSPPTEAQTTGSSSTEGSVSTTVETTPVDFTELMCTQGTSTEFFNETVVQSHFDSGSNNRQTLDEFFCTQSLAHPDPVSSSSAGLGEEEQYYIPEPSSDHFAEFWNVTVDEPIEGDQKQSMDSTLLTQRTESVISCDSGISSQTACGGQAVVIHRDDQRPDSGSQELGSLLASTEEIISPENEECFDLQSPQDDADQFEKRFHDFDSQSCDTIIEVSAPEAELYDDDFTKEEGYSLRNVDAYFTKSDALSVDTNVTIMVQSPSSECFTHSDEYSTSLVAVDSDETTATTPPELANSRDSFVPGAQCYYDEVGSPSTESAQDTEFDLESDAELEAGVSDDLNNGETQCDTSERSNSINSSEALSANRASKEPQCATIQVTLATGQKRQVDLIAIEPYKKVISHGGYYEGLNSIMVFCACYLPDRSNIQYNYLMDHLFLYVVNTLDRLVAQDYIIIYIQGGASSSQMPYFTWLRRCYHLIDKRHVSHTEPGLDLRFRKNLKGLFLVHPSFWLRTIVAMSKPFISKFSQKIKFIESLNELFGQIAIERTCIPDAVYHFDRQQRSVL